MLMSKNVKHDVSKDSPIESLMQPNDACRAVANKQALRIS